MRAKQLYACLLKSTDLVFECTCESKAPRWIGNQGHEKLRNWPQHTSLLLNIGINKLWITNGTTAENFFLELDQNNDIFYFRKKS